MVKPEKVTERFHAYDRSGNKLAIIATEVPNPLPEPNDDSDDWEGYATTIPEYRTAIGRRLVRYGTTAETKLARDTGFIGGNDELLVIEDDDTLLRRTNSFQGETFGI